MHSLSLMRKRMCDESESFLSLSLSLSLLLYLSLPLKKEKPTRDKCARGEREWGCREFDIHLRLRIGVERVENHWWGKNKTLCQRVERIQMLRGWRGRGKKEQRERERGSKCKRASEGRKLKRGGLIMLSLPLSFPFSLSLSLSLVTLVMWVCVSCDVVLN